jgi:hypothetical protein
MWIHRCQQEPKAQIKDVETKAQIKAVDGEMMSKMVSLETTVLVQNLETKVQDLETKVKDLTFEVDVNLNRLKGLESWVKGGFAAVWEKLTTMKATLERVEKWNRRSRNWKSPGGSWVLMQWRVLRSRVLLAFCSET